jgi:hypothetical protein
VSTASNHVDDIFWEASRLAPGGERESYLDCLASRSGGGWGVAFSPDGKRIASHSGGEWVLGTRLPKR